MTTTAFAVHNGAFVIMAIPTSELPGGADTVWAQVLGRAGPQSADPSGNGLSEPHRM